MKIIISFLIFTSVLCTHAQSYKVYNNVLEKYYPLEERIKGMWILEKQEIKSTIYNKKSLEIEVDNRHLLIFRNDSIISNQEQERYYTRKYENSYSLILNSSDNERIEIFSGKKKKRRILDSYEIVKCTSSQLVLAHYTNSEAQLTVENYYTILTYKRDVEELNLKANYFLQDVSISQIYDVDIPFTMILNSSNDTISENHKKAVNFNFQPNSEQLDVLSYGVIDGVYFNSNYMVDYSNQKIYFGLMNPVVYDYELNGDEIKLKKDTVLSQKNKNLLE